MIFLSRIALQDGDQPFRIVMLEYIRSREYAKSRSYAAVPVGGYVHFTCS
jgi:hypothetical protein